MSTGWSAENERATLLEFLGYKREALIDAITGLTEAQARMTPTVSALSLLSLIKHSAIWERRWFQVFVAGLTPEEWSVLRAEEQGATFQLSDEDTVERVVADYRAQIAASNEIVNAFDLDAPCVLPEMAGRNVRWVAFHMLEETAHHAGHADIIRETIDGRRGR